MSAGVSVWLPVTPAPSPANFSLDPQSCPCDFCVSLRSVFCGVYSLPDPGHCYATAPTFEHTNNKTVQFTMKDTRTGNEPEDACFVFLDIKEAEVHG